MDIAFLVRRITVEKIVHEEDKKEIRDFVASHETLEDKDILFIYRLTKTANYFVERNPRFFEESLLERLFLYSVSVAGRAKGTDSAEYPKHNLSQLEYHLNSFAGNFAKAKFFMIKSKTASNHSSDAFSKMVYWGERWYSQKYAAAQKSEHTDKKYSSCAYAFATDVAMQMYKLTKDQAWGKRWFKSSLKSAELSKDFDPRHSTLYYRLAAYAASSVYKLTKDKKYAKLGLKYYGKFLDSVDLYPELFKLSTIRIAQSEIRYLKQSIQRQEWR